MAQLRQDNQKFIEQDTQVIVVGPDNSRQFANYWQQNKLPFIGLPDPGHRVLKLFGQEVNLFKLGRMPAQAIIDRNGIVRYVHYGNSMSDIPESEELIAELIKINNEEHVLDL